MEKGPVEDNPGAIPEAIAPAGAVKTMTACLAGICIPGLGHALLGKWERALVFFTGISVMFTLGIQLKGRLFDPSFESFFASLKFFAEAGSGLLYWISWFLGAGTGDPTAYTYDYANVFIYVAGLLNMLVVIDAYDIALGRKQ